MCISYHIHWACDHIAPLDEEATKCTTYLAKANHTARGTCPLGLTVEELRSDEVCPACAARFLGLAERAEGRRTARMEGRLVDEMDEDVEGSQRALDAWLAKQKRLQERVAAFLFVSEKGMVDEGVLAEWHRQLGMK